MISERFQSVSVISGGLGLKVSMNLIVFERRFKMFHDMGLSGGFRVSSIRFRRFQMTSGCSRDGRGFQGTPARSKGFRGLQGAQDEICGGLRSRPRRFRTFLEVSRVTHELQRV